MKIVLLALCSGCVGMTHRFVQTDEEFKPTPRREVPKVLVDEREIDSEPLFKAVGVLEVRGKATETLDTFLAKVADAGARVGCDVVVQRDAFELGARVRVPGQMGREWQRDDVAAWQFFCGMHGATATEAAVSRKIALAKAVKMRDDEMDSDVCRPGMALGSRVRTTRVCADAPQAR